MVVMLLNLNQNLGSHTSIARLAAVVSNNPRLDSRLVPLNRVQKYSAKGEEAFTSKSHISLCLDPERLLISVIFSVKLEIASSQY